MAAERCEQCGRVGTKGFKVYEPQEVTARGVTFMTERFVECVGKVACRRRQRERVRKLGALA